MTIRLEAAVQFSGSTFSPLLVEEKTGLLLSRKLEVGGLATTGPFKGTPSSFGSASLYPPPTLSTSNDVYAELDWIVNELSLHIASIKSSGADDIYLDVAVYYRDQCNFALEPELLRKIADLKIPFWVSCYEETVD
ncbi:hypothetical protein [Brevibacillus sp. SIMBA_040]|uniref:hypothetical protein n=1 Tax=unclassified Brevibacillus TaxID=2684853 RepID=UPI00397B9053